AERERFSKVDSVRTEFLNGQAPKQLAVQNWTTHEWLYFLRKLPKPLDMDKMIALDETFQFTESGNSEIANLWFVAAIAAQYQKAYPAIDAFLKTVGRRKFLTPLYGELLRTGQKDWAVEMYKKYRKNYHHIAQGTIDDMLK